MKRIILFIVAAMVSSIGLMAQTKITGTVVDKDNQPLMDVQVSSADGTVAVATDIDGRFEIAVPAGSKLTFSMLGGKAMTKEPADGMVVVMNNGKSNGKVGSFQGMFDINSNFTSSHGGVGADIILGSRLRQFYHIGAGIGVHSLMGKAYYDAVDDEVKDNNMFATLYLNNAFYIPTCSKISPLFDCAVGCDLGWLGVNQEYKKIILGLYAKAGFGFDLGMFRMSVGYELIGVHTGYVRVGINF